MFRLYDSNFLIKQPNGPILIQVSKVAKLWSSLSAHQQRSEHKNVNCMHNRVLFLTTKEKRKLFHLQKKYMKLENCVNPNKQNRKTEKCKCHSIFHAQSRGLKKKKSKNVVEGFHSMLSKAQKTTTKI